MASTIITKYSSTASAVPVSGDLTQGELAVNTADKRLFTKNSGGTVVELGTNPASLALPNGTANGVAYLNGSKVVTTGSALTFDGTNLALTLSNNTPKYIGVAYSTVPAYLSNSYDGSVGLSTFSNNTWNNSNGTSSWAAFANSGYASAALQLSSSGDMRFLTSSVANTNPSEQMRLTTTGLGIGLGGSSPAGRVDSSGDGTNPAGIFRRGGAYGNIESTDTARTAKWTFGRDNAVTGNFVIALNNSTYASIDTSGNLGLGVTPSAWSSMTALQVKQAALVGYFNQNKLMANSYFNGSAYTYIASDYASELRQDSGKFMFLTAPSGTAGNPITFTQAMTLDASGNLGVGATSLGSFRFKALGTGGNLSGNAYFVALVGEGAASNKGVGLGYDSSSQTGVIYAETASAASNLAFWTYSGSAWGERARIDSSGNLLVGTTSTGNSNSKSFVANIASGFIVVNHVSGQGSGSGYASFGYNASEIGSITQNGTTGVLYNITSDYRLKDVISAVTGSGERIDALKPVNYTWKADGSAARGFLAHEFKEVYANSVVGEKDAVDEKGNPVYQQMQASTTEVIADLVAELQSLRKRVAQLEGK